MPLTRKSFLTFGAVLLALAVGVSHAGVAKSSRSPARPVTEYFGLRLGLDREEAHERLERVGRSKGEHEGGEQGEEKEGESWTLKDPRFGYAAVGFDASGRLSWYSLFTRRGGRPLLIREIGDLARAERKGNYIYVWSIPSRSGRPACRVVARSQNPDTLQSLSVSVAAAPVSHPMPADSLH